MTDEIAMRKAQVGRRRVRPDGTCGDDVRECWKCAWGGVAEAGAVREGTGVDEGWKTDAEAGEGGDSRKVSDKTGWVQGTGRGRRLRERKIAGFCRGGTGV